MFIHVTTLLSDYLVTTNLWRKKIQCAFYTSRNAWQNYPAIAFKSFCTAINDGFHCGFINRAVLVIIQKRENHSIDPSPSYNGVQSTYNEMEILIEIFIKVLYLVVVRDDFRTRNSTIDKLCSNFSLITAIVKKFIFNE